LIVPPAEGPGGITAGFGKILKFIHAKSSTACTTEADMTVTEKIAVAVKAGTGPPGQ